MLSTPSSRFRVVLVAGLAWSLVAVTLTAQVQSLDSVPLVFVFLGLLGLSFWAAWWVSTPADGTGDAVPGTRESNG